LVNDQAVTGGVPIHPSSAALGKPRQRFELVLCDGDGRQQQTQHRNEQESCA
jgi:hypothetical protein